MTEQASATLSSRQKIMDASRRLFEQKGFHAAPMSELAATAKVSIGQIYRHFASKGDIIVAIAEGDAQANLTVLEEIFESADRGELSPAEAIEMFAYNSLTRLDVALWLEIQAESHRNPRVADAVRGLTDSYEKLVRRLAIKTQPALGDSEREACVEIMTACFFGLGMRASLRQTDPREISRATACLIVRALDVSGGCDEGNTYG
ncbi:MAG: hypothetical protein JWQ16_84 [Novosphingobium sp.]|nr:hypothetical protein [Novosphingobium sp.]